MNAPNPPPDRPALPLPDRPALIAQWRARASEIRALLAEPPADEAELRERLESGRTHEAEDVTLILAGILENCADQLEAVSKSSATVE